jgi:small-conductance mechanosensitive channel
MNVNFCEYLPPATHERIGSARSQQLAGYHRVKPQGVLSSSEPTRYNSGMHNELTLTTPALLFSAISLIMLAYTNRFLSYAQLVRSLHDRFIQTPTLLLHGQIKNLRHRLHLTRYMQLFGILSLFFCVLSMFLIYVNLQPVAAVAFGIGLLLLIVSLGLSVWEIQISTQALELHLKVMEAPRRPDATGEPN